MDQDTEETKVIFRWWKKDVIAIFPDELGDYSPSTCSSYMHVGQHGSCEPNGIIYHSRLATPEEYKALAEELTSLGYKLRVMKKMSGNAIGIRRKELKRIEETA